MSDSKKFAIEAKLQGKVVFRGIIENTPLSLGRSKSCDIPLEKLDFLSRQHISFEMKGETLIFKDLDSANGVYVNGKKLEEGPISEALNLEIGALKINFKEITSLNKSAGFQSKEKTVTEISIHGSFQDSLELQLHNEQLAAEKFGDNISIEYIGEPDAQEDEK
ncbi:MAG: FHA domain-containing protein [Bdellovibrionota bacterium]|nr:FHA domain-containing protein [Bdellovibrionota bacterium]